MCNVDRKCSAIRSQTLVREIFSVVNMYFKFIKSPILRSTMTSVFSAGILPTRYKSILNKGKQLFLLSRPNVEY